MIIREMGEMNEISDNKQIFCSPDNFPSLIRGIIADLRSIIDQIGTNLKSAKELIIELAKRLYEEKICEKCKISSLVKYLLRDKITEGKITARWVEGCLPDDYKRNYTKCEENSHLEKPGNYKKFLSITAEEYMQSQYYRMIRVKNMQMKRKKSKWEVKEMERAQGVKNLKKH
jgi:hypothetical protein